MSNGLEDIAIQEPASKPFERHKPTTGDYILGVVTATLFGGFFGTLGGTFIGSLYEIARQQSTQPEEFNYHPLGVGLVAGAVIGLFPFVYSLIKSIEYDWNFHDRSYIDKVDEHIGVDGGGSCDLFP